MSFERTSAALSLSRAAAKPALRAEFGPEVVSADGARSTVKDVIADRCDLAAIPVRRDPTRMEI